MSKLLFVISGNQENYFEIFKVVNSIGDLKFEIDQASWEDISFTVYTNDLTKNGIILNIFPSKTPIKGTPQEKKRTIKPDFLLIRNIVHGNKGYDYRNLLYGFIYSGIPCVNSLGSILHFLERPIMHAELLQIQKKLGKKNFPLIEQTFYPSFREMNFHPEYPLVLKVGHVHAGYGKIKVENEDVFNDTTSILAINGNYSTAEPFYKGKYDLRIQCIGDHIRVYKREGYNWKTNTGPAILSDVEITSIYKIWVDEVKKIYKGFDIFAIDVIHTEDDEEYILEVNDSSIGLGPNHATEDLNYIKELVLKKMKESFQIKELVKIEKQDKEVELLNLKNNINEQRETIKQLIEEVEILKAEKIRYKKLIQQKSEEKSSGISFYYLYIPAFILIILLLIKFFS